MAAKLKNVTIECSVVAGGGAEPFKLGDPVAGLPSWDKERCIRCGICYVYCPTGAVVKVEDGFFDVDKGSCNGCGICHRECLCGVIGMVGEE